MTAKTKKPAAVLATIDLGLGGVLPEPDNSDDSVPVRVLHEIKPIGAAGAELIPVTDDTGSAQLQVCLDDFGFAAMTAKEFMGVGIEELNQSMLKACRAGTAFWAAQEALKNDDSAAVESVNISATTTGVVDTFKGWIESNGLAEQRVYECIKLAKFYARLPEAQRSKVLTIGKKQALLLARTPQEVIDHAAESGQDMLDKAEVMTYDQLREHLRSAEQRGKRLESEIDHRDAVIAKMKQRNPVYQFSPQTHFVREECLVFQAESELALNSLWALFEETANEDTSTPEWRMRLEQVWVTAHVVTARAVGILNKIKDYAPVSDLPESVLADHRLTDAEASDWLLEYQLLERKHFAAKAEREKKRQDNLPKGPGRPRKEG